MSHRNLNRDATQERKRAYREMEESGEMQEAIFEALEHLADAGHDLGQKFDATRKKRQRLKRRLRRRQQ